MAPDIPEVRQQVVQPEPGGEFPARDARAAVHRPGELERLDERAGRVEENAPLAARLGYEMEVAVLEVAHAAVHEARRPARRAAREVLALDERHAQPPERRVPRAARARGAPAPDEDGQKPA